MQEIINQLTLTMSQLKAKKQQLLSIKSVDYDSLIAEYQKAIDTLKEL